MNEETKQKRLGEQIVGVFRWVREQWRTNPLVCIIVGLLIGFVALEYYLFYIAGWEWADWTGFGEHIGPKIDPNKEYYRAKTLWDLLELLIVPAVLAISAWLFSRAERKSEQQIAKDRRNQATLEAYFDRMTELFLKEGLRESKKGNKVRTIARTRTLAVLRSLDGRRKGQVAQFLYEADLIDGEHPVVELGGADLSEADLYRANLGRINLIGADLRKANLRGIALIEADLRNADLDKASLDRASLRECNLEGAKLRSASLIRADLSKANLSRVNLSGATLLKTYLGGADLGGADLSGADLTEATITNEQLAQVWSLKGATLLDGTKLSEENWRAEFGEWRNGQD